MRTWLQTLGIEEGTHSVEDRPIDPGCADARQISGDQLFCRLDLLAGLGDLPGDRPLVMEVLREGHLSLPSRVDTIQQDEDVDIRGFAGFSPRVRAEEPHVQQLASELRL